MNQNNAYAMNHGAHDILDSHEILGSMVGALNKCIFLRPHVQDPALLSILDRQFQFMTDTYNTILQAYQTGQDPSQPTKSYAMQLSHDFKYGLTSSPPKSPLENAQAIDDETISGWLLAMHKEGASGKITAALECTNPVLRRVIQDSIANCIEMAYEIAIYQNHKGYYQVVQLEQQDMQLLLNCFGPSSPKTKQ